jgi:hypothetical protein
MKKSQFIVSVSISAIALVLSSSGFAAEANTLSVKCVRKVEKSEVVHYDEKTGRYAGFSQAACIYKEVKGTGLFDGVKSTARGFDDFRGPNGDVRGITVGEKGGDSYRVEWDGHCFNVAGGDGKPVSRCFGSWRFVDGSGTGRFAKIHGGGYFQTTSLTQESFEAEATGYYEQ